ncbi:MAG TPA: helix-turn-helix domain-containing protein [Candidatus Aminicenantes bacterium]|nr:helix-turn-helix domain-containing protein [Candidatus Aminicenantes bacterium]HRY65546.1 helix-turn-helix domain-containing protein [Candidatus Aminicenantes bacterium]HRZ72566.1 helix-turn-helix domain-containing protein [Candidatus Aminicenantes bacterium]
MASPVRNGGRKPGGSRAAEAPAAVLSRELIELYLRQVCLEDRAGLKGALDRLERDIIVYVLEQTNGRQNQAARILGLKPTTLHYKLRSLGIVPVRKFETVVSRR